MADAYYAAYSIPLGESATAADKAALESTLPDDFAYSTSDLGADYAPHRQPCMKCPITGLRFPYFAGRFRNGSLVDPRAFDRWGYRELPDTWNAPEPQLRPMRPRFTWWAPSGR